MKGPHFVQKRASGIRRELRYIHHYGQDKAQHQFYRYGTFSGSVVFLTRDGTNAGGR